MGEVLEVKIRSTECAGGCLHTADLALVLRTLDHAIRVTTPAVAIPRLAIVHISETGDILRLRMDQPTLSGEAPKHPLLDLVEAQASGLDGLCLGASLPRRINALELSCGTARAIAHNSLSYDNWPKAVAAQGEHGDLPRSTPRPYTPPTPDQLLNFDAEEFNREVAEARVDGKPWWE